MFTHIDEAPFPLEKGCDFSSQLLTIKDERVLPRLDQTGVVPIKGPIPAGKEKKKDFVRLAPSKNG